MNHQISAEGKEEKSSDRRTDVMDLEGCTKQF